MVTPVHAPVKTFSCNLTGFLRNKDTGHSAVTRMSCNCWKCAKCSEARLKPFWCEHLSRLIAGHAGPMYFIECPSEDAETVSKRFSRAKANYCRIKTDTGVVFFGTKRVKGSTELSATDATKRACAAITECTSLKRGVSTSRAWKRPDKPESLYEVVAFTNKDVTEAAIAIAKERGIKASKWASATVGLDTRAYDAAQTRELFIDICFKNAEMQGECPIYSDSPPDTSGPSSNSDIPSDIWRLTDAEIDAFASQAA